MKLLKKWGIGDLVKNQSSFPIDGTTEYNHIEALDGSDIDNHISIRRSVRNIMENEENIEEYFNAVLSQIASGDNDRTVLVNSFSDFQQSFKVDADDIIYFDDIDTTRKAFLRVNPGIGMLNFSPVIVKPQIFVAERELEKIFNLDTWHPQPESATILHDYDSMKFHLQIEKKDGSGNVITYQFANGGVYGDLGSTQASTTVTSVSGSGASFTVLAVNKAAYDGTDGNGITVQFLNSGFTGLEVDFLDGARTININLGGSDATAAEIVEQINLLRDFEANVVLAGNFTAASDSALSEDLAGGAEPVGYNNSIEMFMDLGAHSTLGSIFRTRVTSYSSLALEQLIELPISAAVDIHVGFDIDGNLVTTDHPTVPYMQLWRVQVDTSTETAPTITDERLGYNLTEYDYDWNSSATYSLNDVVFENGKIWRALQTSVNVRPSEDTLKEYWYQISESVGNWYPTITYSVDELVIDGGKIYKSLVGSNLNNQPSLGDGTNWELLEKEYADTTAIVYAIALG